MDISQKLENWSKHATNGQRRVLLEAKREIDKTRVALLHCVNAIKEWEKNPNNIDQFMLGIMLGAMDNANKVLDQKESE